MVQYKQHFGINIHTWYIHTKLWNRLLNVFLKLAVAENFVYKILNEG